VEVVAQCKMQEDDNIFDHIKKMKELKDQLACFEVPMINANVVITLLELATLIQVFHHGFEDKTHLRTHY